MEAVRISRLSMAQAGASLPGYLVESTAPLNVDDPSPPPIHPERVTAWRDRQVNIEPLELADGIAEVAERLRVSRDRRMVIAVHGYNTPAPVAVSSFAQLYAAASGDRSIADSREADHPVMLCYRWPSSKLGSIFGSSIRASPSVSNGLAVIATLLIAASLLVPALLPGPDWIGWVARLVYMLGVLVFAIPFATMILRGVVYFRDAYRATHYGIPDLVEFVRLLDRELGPRLEAGLGPLEDEERVHISLIGHSMGGYVVTGAIRILSDVFDLTAVGGADGKGKGREPRMGQALWLSRLVLVSPDIPGETILMGRASFLASSVRRVSEGYLFSNEGDVVLRMISTLANYFSFPTLDRDHGFRLGNVGVCPPNPTGPPEYGVIDPSERDEGEALSASFLRRLRIGARTMLDLRRSVTPQPEAPLADGTESAVPLKFTYVDCTNYVDGPDTRRVGMLTRAKGKRGLSALDYWDLLLSYLSGIRHVDVHSGYFRGAFVRDLILRYAFLGWHQTLESLSTGRKGFDALEARCKTHQVRMLLSPSLLSPPPTPPDELQETELLTGEGEAEQHQQPQDEGRA